MEKRQGAGGDYIYDANGNLKTDPNKGITLIEYNHLNLPMKVTFDTGNTIEWLYDAGGRKLRKTAIAPTYPMTRLFLSCGRCDARILFYFIPNTAQTNDCMLLKGLSPFLLLGN